jgi:pimeloyl-ACP methyl ester carboxylesterase
MPVELFSPPYSQPAVDDLHDRLHRARWPAALPGPPWAHGFDQQTLIDLCAWWRDSFDWRAQIDRFSAFDHRLLVSADSRIHFVHARGRGPRPLPLILTHGWPGSFVEFLSLVPLLTDPAGHGADQADSFDVVIPTLPGYGFSGPPCTGMNVFRVAALWVELMRELGYDRFCAQGGDIGAGVTTALGLRYPEHILGIHLNFIPGSYRPGLDGAPPLSEEEERFVADQGVWRDAHGAYAHLQSTRPQTPGYALNDSPAGLAAWILEKFREWSDCDGDLLRLDLNDLFTNVTLYWMTQTIHSSFRMYYEGRKAPVHLQAGERVSVPCGIAHFPKELMFPPRSWVERGFNVRHWTQMPRGGHFAALEQPELLAVDIRSFFRGLRS